MEWEMTGKQGNQSIDDIERNIERALDAADAASGADRRAITQAAQLDAIEAVDMAGKAMDADEELAEASRFTIMASRTGDRERARTARRREREAFLRAKENHKAATKSAKRAYDAIRFSDPNSLGFLRVIQVFLLLNIIFTSMMLTTFIKGSYTIDFNQTLNLLNVLFDGVIFWLIWKRKKITRACVIAIATFNIVVGTIFNIATGVFDPFAQFALSFTDVFLLVYFIFSKRAKATLVEPFNMRKLNEDLDEEESFFRPKTWEFWRNLIIYFVIFSIVGHWMEAGVCLLIKYGLVPGTYDPTSQIWSDWLYPFPVYGIGFCACAVLLYPLKNLLERKTGKLGVALVLSFLANALVCTMIEFSMGMVVNADLQLWDYSNMFGNFMGQVCLQNALFFGFVATIMTWLVYPSLERFFRRVPNESMTVVFVVVLVGFIILMALYYINITPSDINGALGESTSTADAAGSVSSAAVPSSSAA
jgi:uncharacterized membrane protein